eukprot:gene9938-13369_t
MIRRTINNSENERPSHSNMLFNGRSKKIWTVEEDEQLRKLVEQHSTANWTIIAQALPQRTGKQCRERWHNHLSDGIKKGDWTEEEDRIIITMQKRIGNQWAKITKLLPGRTDNAVKNRFHATERAKSRRGEVDGLYSDDIDEIPLVDIDGNIINIDVNTTAIKVEPNTNYKYLSKRSNLLSSSDSVSLPHATASFSHHSQAVEQAMSINAQSAVLALSDNFSDDESELGDDDDLNDAYNTYFAENSMNVSPLTLRGETPPIAATPLVLDEDYGMELEENNSFDGLMDLDIISFDADMYEEQVPQNQHQTSRSSDSAPARSQYFCGIGEVWRSNSHIQINTTTSQNHFVNNNQSDNCLFYGNSHLG